MVKETCALHQYDLATPGMFNYVSRTEPSLDYVFSRVAKLDPRYRGDSSRLSKEVVLIRAAEEDEACYAFLVNEIGGAWAVG